MLIISSKGEIFMKLINKILSLKGENYRKDMVMNLLLFFSFSFAGWCWEVMLYLVRDRDFVNRGILIGPWLPIYGFGGLILYQLLIRLKKAPVIVFLLGLITCTALEYGASWILEVIFGKRWWDYSDHLVHLNGRVCLIGILCFGIAGLLIVYFLAPVLTRYYSKIPRKIQVLISLMLGIPFLIDVVYSFTRLGI